MEWYNNLGGTSPRQAAAAGVVGSNICMPNVSATGRSPNQHFMSHNRGSRAQIPPRSSLTPMNRVESQHSSRAKKETREPGRYSCKQCDKTFNSKSGLLYHMEKHTGKFRLWCYKCQRGFTMKAQFESHMAKHEGRSFPCEYCPKRFQSKPSLRVHTQKCRSNAQPFQNQPPNAL